MRLTPTLAALCLVVLMATPSLAQRNVYYSVPAPELRSPFHALTLRDYAKALSAGAATRKSSAGSRGPAIDSLIVGQRECPMPVLRPDSARLEPMPVAVVDTASLSTMPVARSSCQNPLQR